MRSLSPFVLLLLSSSAFALSSDSTTSSSLADKADLVVDDVTARPSGKAAAPVGTKDAPFDGKDGMPHAGPWIETAAERDRKKAKESGEEPLVKDVTDDTKAAFSAAKQIVPETNNGVMDDPNRTGPKEGTRGTEGGVSEKLSEGRLSEKVPDSPKELPPLSHSEAQSLAGDAGDAAAMEIDVDSQNHKPLEVPSDLPDKPHDIPPPKSPGSKSDPLSIPSSSTPQTSLPNTLTPEEGIISPFHSLFLSFTMIIFSEIGDKTFLVACLMAMRHPRLVVFTAAFSALITMTVLSAVLGHAVPTLIPKWMTNYAAAGLFRVFGVKMLIEARGMSPDDGVGEEMKEVEMELEEKELQQRKLNRRRSSVSPYVLESGRQPRKTRSSNSRLPSPPDSPSSSSSREPSPIRGSGFSNLLVGLNNLCSLVLSPAWVQTFIMTFLGEWGDRSQIATIAMAAGKDYWWVTGGAVIGHGLCTGAAVIGGRAIAGKVSMKVVTLGGGVAFLIFGFIYAFEAIY